MIADVPTFLSSITSSVHSTSNGDPNGNYTARKSARIYWGNNKVNLYWLCLTMDTLKDHYLKRKKSILNPERAMLI